MSESFKHDITIDQGATFQCVIRFVDNAGNPIDLTGFTAYSQLKRWYSSVTSKDFTCTVNTANSTVALGMAPALTSTISSGRYVYDVMMVDPLNNVTRSVEGQVFVTPGVSNSSIETTPNTYNANVNYVVVPLIG
jgi:hypothetical protein